MSFLCRIIGHNWVGTPDFNKSFSIDGHVYHAWHVYYSSKDCTRCHKHVDLTQPPQ